MTLTSKQAKEIVSLVSADVISTARITGLLWGRSAGSFPRRKTLDPNNPFIYRYADWLLDRNPVQFVNFTRF